MQKIIYISIYPLHGQALKALHIESLLKKNIAIEFWDLGEIFHPYLPKSLSFDFVQKISSLEDYNRRLKLESVDETVICFTQEYDWHNRKLFDYVFKYKFKTSIYRAGYIPVPKNRKKRLLNLLLSSKRQLYQAVLNKVFNRIFKPPVTDYVFGAGSCAPVLKNQTLLKVNYIDYDDFLTNNSDQSDSKKMAVYLDDGFPNHPDFEILGFHFSKEDKNQHIRELNSFFDFIERKFNLTVVIAAHPKVNYPAGFFNGREILYGESQRLIALSKFAMTINSTAVSWCVCYEKPILFLYSEAYLKCIPTGTESAKVMAETLGQKIWSISDSKNYEQINLNAVNIDLYLQYKYKYLTWPETEAKKTSDLIISYAKKI